jgi:hypothetical protein
LDNARLAAQLCGLERRTARGGRDSIDHTLGAYDDLANAAAGALVAAAGILSKAEEWNRFGRAVASLLAALPAPGRVTTSAILYAQQRSLWGFPF